jgi:hypothetical protein
VKKLTFYEQIGIVIPGSVLLFGLFFFFPSLRNLLAKDGISLGQFGVFTLLSYAAGHLIAGIGNVGENILWRTAGGMPSDWVIKKETNLLSVHQRELLPMKIRSRLKFQIRSVVGMDRKSWFPISRQLYADVARYGKSNRLNTFNGNYGLNRGLAAACSVLACVAFVQASWQAGILLLAFAGMYVYRAYRFGVHYARELYLQFLTINEKRDPVRKRQK